MAIEVHEPTTAEQTEWAARLPSGMRGLVRMLAF